MFQFNSKADLKVRLPINFCVLLAVGNRTRIGNIYLAPRLTVSTLKLLTAARQPLDWLLSISASELPRNTYN